MPCVYENFQSVNTFYMLNHPNLAWIPTNISTMLTMPNTIKMINPRWNLTITRVFFDNYTVVGKAHLDDLFVCFFNGYNQTRDMAISTGFDVLVCK